MAAADPVRSLRPATVPPAPGWVFALFLALLAAAPLLFGGNRPLAWRWHALALGALLLLAGPAARWRPAETARLWPAALAFGLVVGWVLLQLLPGLPGVAAAPLWPLAAEALDRPLAEPISLAPALTWAALLRLLTDAAACWLGLTLARGPDRAAALLGTLALAAAGWAAYALAQEALGSPLVLWVEKARFRDVATGPFLGRTAFAAYLAIGLVAALAWWEGRRATWPLLALIPLLPALILTRSRAMLALAAGGAALVLLLRLLAGRGNRRGRLGLALALLVGLGGIGGLGLAWAGAGRGSSLEADAAGRLAVAGMVWRGILERPWTGHGLGSFELAFPRYRGAAIGPEQLWDKAHNIYLEAAFGLGLPAALVLAAGILWLLGLCLRAALRPAAGGVVAQRVMAQGAGQAAVARAAVAAAALLGLHGLVDFTWQIQGISLGFWALVGAGVAPGLVAHTLVPASTAGWRGA